jgi:hypothetical protein
MNYSHLTPAGAVQASQFDERTVPTMRIRIPFRTALLTAILFALGLAQSVSASDTLWP